MKKAFTLIEMLIVVVVIVTLMTMVFRLSSIGDESKRRNETVSRLTRIENCLSGYYAAFGSYPPVELHGSRNINLTVNRHGIQDPDNENTSIWGWNVDKFKNWVESGRNGKYYQQDEDRAWRQVQAACKAQPIDCRFPYNSKYNEVIKAYQQMWQSRLANGGYSEDCKTVLSATIDDGFTDNPGRHDKDKYRWRDVQIFKFGLLSFLLPRYQVMMSQGDSSNVRDFFGTFDDDSDGCMQWKVNNSVPHDPLEGKLFEKGWRTVFDYCARGKPAELAAVKNIPSEAVTARWMPNLEKSICCNHEFKLYGIDIKSDDAPELSVWRMEDMQVYSPGGYKNDSTSQQYLLDCVTILDGWDREVFYYSPAPHQTYTIWSAGRNGRTFPPWIPRDSLDASKNEHVAAWVEDDIARMSN